MKYRIAIWAAAGFLVASGWAVYFSLKDKDLPIEPLVSALLQLTCPIAIVGLHYPVSIYSSLAANAATYAVVGLLVETLRRLTCPLTVQFVNVKHKGYLENPASFHTTSVPPDDLPEEVLQAQSRVAVSLNQLSFAISHHQFVQARFYKNEERKARENLREMRKKYGIGDPT